MQVQEAQRVPNKTDAKRPPARHIIIKMPKVKDEENLKSSKRREVSTYRRVAIRLSTDFPKQTLQAGRDGKTYSKS